jgi:Domain of unknown function (DUF5664)
MNRLIEEEIEKQELEKEAEKEYYHVLKTSGMFFVWYPHLNGNWEDDKIEYLNIYKNVIEMRKIYKKHQIPQKKDKTEEQKGLSTRHKSNSGETHTEIPKFVNQEFPMTPDDSLRTKVGEIHWKALKIKRNFKELNFQQKTEKQGVKANKNKPQLSLLFKQFPKALEAIAKCSEYGHKKYKETDKDYLNYTRVYGGSKTYADAGLRHRLEQGNDSESGLPHQLHVAWNALAELQLWIQENE